MRAPFQVLIIPYRRLPRGVEYAVLRRADLGWWQFVSGGGEGDETPLQAAEREVLEELGVAPRGRLRRLDTISSVPKDAFSASNEWGEGIYVVPEYCFAMEIAKEKTNISSEHKEMRWVDYDAARDLLEWDGNRTALWELGERLSRGDLHEAE
jgi:dATP pyrophosphohydrolase